MMAMASMVWPPPSVPAWNIVDWGNDFGSYDGDSIIPADMLVRMDHPGGGPTYASGWGILSRGFLEVTPTATLTLGNIYAHANDGSGNPMIGEKAALYMGGGSGVLLDSGANSGRLILMAGSMKILSV